MKKKELKAVKYGWAIWDEDEKHFEWDDGRGDHWQVYRFYRDAKFHAKNYHKNARVVRVKYTKTMTILSRIPIKERIS